MNTFPLQMKNLQSLDLGWVFWLFSILQSLLFASVHKTPQGKVSKDPNVNQVPMTTWAKCHGTEPSMTHRDSSLQDSLEDTG